jgi:hypothetical protein
MNKTRSARDKAMDNALEDIKEIIAGLQGQDYQGLYFKARYEREGAKLNNIENGKIENINKLLRGYYKTEQPDKILIEFFDDTNAVVALKKISLPKDEEQQREQQPAALNGVPPGYIGLGEVEEIVTRKVNLMEEKRLYNEAVNNVNSLTEKVARLEEEKQGLERTIAAKDNMEFYSKIIGMALPGLSQFLTNTAIGPAITMLAGTGSENGNQQTQAEQPTDERTSMTHMIAEFCTQLTEQELASVYLVMAEMERDRTNIQKVLQFISQHKS